MYSPLPTSSEPTREREAGRRVDLASSSFDDVTSFLSLFDFPLLPFSLTPFNLTLLLPFFPTSFSFLSGDDPATSRQLSFISLLEQQHPSSSHLSYTKRDSLTKTEASEIIDALKNRKKIEVDEPEDGGPKESTEEEKAATTSHNDDASPSATATSNTEKEGKDAEPGTEEYLDHPEGWATGESTFVFFLLTLVLLFWNRRKILQS